MTGVSKFQFNGKGADLLIKLLVGYLLTIVTLGIYMPWFIADLTRFFVDNTELGGPQGKVSLKFNGTGGNLFVICLTNFLLCLVTLMIYTPWAVVRFNRWQMENVTATDAAGHTFNVRFAGTGAALFWKLVGGYLLTVITLGIFFPWFLVWLMRFYADNTTVTQGGQTAFSFSYAGTGGQLFVVVLVGALLTFITLGIYYPWFVTRFMKFNAGALRIQSAAGERSQLAFSGTGGKLFVELLLGILLVPLTLTIYLSWFIVRVTRWQVDHLEAAPAGGAGG